MRKSATYGQTDFEAVSHGGNVAFMPTTDVALHPVHWVKPAFINQACGQRMIHGGVIGSLPSFRLKG